MVTACIIVMELGTFWNILVLILMCSTVSRMRLCKWKVIPCSARQNLKLYLEKIYSCVSFICRVLSSWICYYPTYCIFHSKKYVFLSHTCKQSIKDEALTNESNVHQHSKRLIITLQFGGRGRGEVGQEKEDGEEEGEGGEGVERGRGRGVGGEK